MSRLNRWLALKGRKKKKTRKEKNQKEKEIPKETNRGFVAALNHTRFERITFRSGVERATVAPAVLVEKIFAYLVLLINQVFPRLLMGGWIHRHVGFPVLLNQFLSHLQLLNPPKSL